MQLHNNLCLVMINSSKVITKNLKLCMNQNEEVE